ncbi:MAG: putative lipid II flippase FtsW [Verrucomicrobia bacterium]|nr:putative lipid II flippase FtsW [Verrucomicrobiota bacterium]
MRSAATTLAGITVILLSFGIVMLASTSNVKAAASYDDPHFFLKRQIVWLLISIVIGAALTHFDYHWWQRLAIPLAVIAVILLVLVLVPGIGTSVKGSRRWLRMSFISIQPSEIAKFASVIFMAAWMTRIGRKSQDFVVGLLVPLGVLGVITGLMFKEPDFGTTVLTGAVGAGIMFVGGTRFLYMLGPALLALAGFAFAVARDDVRRERILAFLMPEKYPEKAYHLAQSMIAFIMGGLKGVGFGDSAQKQHYLPEAHTDFILAIIGEELGFGASLAVILLFAGILVCGMIISYKAPDTFGRYLAFGMTMMLVLQACINVGVVTGCLPTKGLPLPFISYGGSSLAASVAMVCTLINIGRHCENEQADDHTRLMKDSLHRF